MEWGFHPPPEHPSPVDPLADPFATNNIPPKEASHHTNPLPLRSTILFSPLQEYKLRGSFAQPRLVVTHYTDLAHSHDIVLLRGEIMASPSGGFLLSQVDAQLLALAVQKFYLPAETPQSQNAFKILRSFHEAPEQFDYKELVAAGDDGIGA